MPGYDPDGHFKEHLFLGKIIAPSKDAYLIDVRNKFETNQPIEVFKRNEAPVADVVLEIRDTHGIPVTTAKAGQQVTVKLKHRHGNNDIIRKTPQ